jgi:hypothetical protein
VRVDAHDVTTDGWTQVERDSVDGWRWWDLDGLAASGERVYPTSLVDQLRLVLAEGAPEHPVDVGT